MTAPHTIRALADDLARLGVRAGDTLMVHVSLRAVGRTEGGADGLLRALEQAVGETGTLLMVLGARNDWAWVNQLPEPERAAKLEGADPFDALQIPADPDVGTFAELFRQQAGTIVSDHPEGRFAARGHAAAELLDDPPWDDYFGPGSPLERLLQRGGKVLRLGASPDSTTLMHYAEYLTDVPDKRRARRHRLVRTARGAEVRVVDCLDDNEGIVDYPAEDYFAACLRAYLATGHARTGTVGSAASELIEARDIVPFAVEWMNTHLAPATTTGAGERPDPAAIVLINHQGLKVLKGLQLQSPSPSIGLAYLGAHLEQHGLSYTAIDACGLAMDQIRPYPEMDGVFVQGLTVSEVVERIPAQARIVGFTCLYSHCWPLVVDLAVAARERLPDAVFVLGGEHPTAMPRESLASGPFDVVVLGEGEETFLELAQRILGGKSWRSVPGTAVLAGDELRRNPPRPRIRQIDDLPLPDWDAWCIREYIRQEQVSGIHLGPAMPILGSRGCPYDCKFCSNAGMWTRRYLMRSPVALVDEMERMKHKYGVTGFVFMDSNFVISRQQTLAFAEELIRRGLDIHYQLPAGTRCEAFDEELARALSASGLRNFAFAPESGSPEILDAIRKEMDPNRVLPAIQTVLDTRTTVCCFIVIGVPEDTPETLKDTLRLVRRLALAGVHDITVSKFTPYPGSDYYDELCERGLVTPSMADLGGVISFFSADRDSYAPGLSAEALHRWMLRMYTTFYAVSFARRPWRPMRQLAVFARSGQERTRYMRMFAELSSKRRHWRRRSADARTPHASR